MGKNYQMRPSSTCPLSSKMRFQDSCLSMTSTTPRNWLKGRSRWSMALIWWAALRLCSTSTISPIRSVINSAPLLKIWRRTLIISLNSPTASCPFAGMQRTRSCCWDYSSCSEEDSVSFQGSTQSTKRRFIRPTKTWRTTAISTSSKLARNNIWKVSSNQQISSFFACSSAPFPRSKTSKGSSTTISTISRTISSYKTSSCTAKSTSR